ncbi:probable protein phosphatase 2C 55 isoform X1 [Actinidia eriantha]|uniref:probable protein phosphatase 2C 55 isoform X1 n=1 Tax=Actinidia eriantha TaxID=165200 RepID=UPI00258521C1|nr:probable protein phosphatase 2C 55 isoform X1 [Actinidia eriantha]XP_057509971.1 probable protein phosphatase 2C 55 isoform X1 [Actinidia eriantha]XP_057509972.1 probable protein phosphatase 2C 55 isoform X1 [Actinidia eriantha]XP_057509973.1 probable protein phosphatase 2C 55 isoform X1 [Actinidia eriantha]
MDSPQPTVPDRSREKGLKMVCGSFYIPKQKDSKPQGDDAHFICAEKQTIGVADGVGGWSSKGVDAGQYARELMANSIKAIQDEEKGGVDPRRVIDEAYSNTNVEGSSTACILTLKNNKLHAANVGDSGFMLIREWKDVYKSPVQQHSFNHPYQLGNETSCDRPSAARTYKVPVKLWDVIVMGTDGLFDNIFADNIVDIAKMVIENGAEPEQVAWAIAEHAYYNSLDKSAATPYSEAALMAGKERLGGKPDDITVIVAFVVEK